VKGNYNGATLDVISFIASIKIACDPAKIVKKIENKIFSVVYYVSHLMYKNASPGLTFKCYLVLLGSAFGKKVIAINT